MTRTCSAERRPAIVEILVESDEFDLIPADADAEAESPAAQHVERSRLLCDQHRLTLRQYQYTDGKADLLRAAGKKPEQDEGVVIGGGCRADAPAAVVGSRVGAEHMIRRHQMAEAQPLRRLR
jgi:hypothetical protein